MVSSATAGSPASAVTPVILAAPAAVTIPAAPYVASAASPQDVGATRYRSCEHTIARPHTTMSRWISWNVSGSDAMDKAGTLAALINSRTLAAPPTKQISASTHTSLSTTSFTITSTSHTTSSTPANAITQWQNRQPGYQRRGESMLNSIIQYLAPSPFVSTNDTCSFIFVPTFIFFCSPTVSKSIARDWTTRLASQYRRRRRLWYRQSGPPGRRVARQRRMQPYNTFTASACGNGPGGQATRPPRCLQD